MGRLNLIEITMASWCSPWRPHSFATVSSSARLSQANAEQQEFARSDADLLRREHGLARRRLAVVAGVELKALNSRQPVVRRQGQ